MQNDPEVIVDDDLEIWLEIARRANWDALHGPPHLRAGKFRPESPEPPNGQSPPEHQPATPVAPVEPS